MKITSLKSLSSSKSVHINFKTTSLINHEMIRIHFLFGAPPYDCKMFVCGFDYAVFLIIKNGVLTKFLFVGLIAHILKLHEYVSVMFGDSQLLKNSGISSINSSINSASNSLHRNQSVAYVKS